MDTARSDLRVVRHWVEAGTSEDISPLLYRAWDELPELKYQTYAAFEAGYMASLDYRARLQVLLYDGTALVGGAVLVYEQDVHVGDCVSVVWHYVLPEYRPSHLPREVSRAAIAFAKVGGVRTIAYTHRTKVGDYVLRYRRIR